MCIWIVFFLSVLTHTVGFGLPSSFSWLDKYNNKKESDDNPFETDVFDPLKYMNLQDDDKGIFALSYSFLISCL